MSLSDASREALWKEWKELVPDKEKKIQLGQILFRRIFETYPDFIKLFKRFNGMTSLDEIIQSTEMKAHSLRFMNSLNGVFETLDNPAELGDMLKHVGSSHKLRNVTCDHFAATVPVLQDILLENLKSEEAKEAVKIVLSVAGPIIFEGYKE